MGAESAVASTKRISAKLEGASDVSQGVNDDRSDKRALQGDEPLVSRQTARAVATLGVVLVVADHWIVGSLVLAATYITLLRPRVERRLANDAGLFLVWACALLVSDALTWRGADGQARRELNQLKQEVVGYQQATGQFPASLTELGWRLPSVFPEGKPVDPWQRNYGYRAPGAGKPGVLSSRGPDAASADDDLSVSVP